MTKAAAKQLKAVGVPSVRWSDEWGQYWTRIGYNRTANGNRGRARFYLGRDESAAVAKAAGLKQEWRMLKAAAQGSASAVCWPLERSPASADLGRLSPIEQAAAVAVFHAEQTSDAIADGEVTTVGREERGGQAVRHGTDPAVVWQTPTHRIEQVAKLFGEYREAKGTVKAATLVNDARNLRAAIAAYNGQLLIADLRYAEVEAWRDAILRRQRNGEIGRRTANNYLGEVHRLLDWCHRTPTIAYRHPEDVDALFIKLRNATAPNIAEYNPTDLLKIVKAATDRQRLYIYLALNLGAYQSDISDLRADEITTYNGVPCVIRRRSKTSHQNEFAAMHILWPETENLLRRQMARQPNEHDRALLNEAGRPLLRKAPHSDCISDSYLLLQKRTARLPFKQYRKLGATAIQRIGGDEARRLYKAGTVGDGDRLYVRDSYQKLVPHLIAWGDELRRDAILF
jgi:hypothetical protein